MQEKKELLKDQPLAVRLLTAKDLETVFQCGRKKSYEIMNAKGFPSFRIDDRLYVEEGELSKWIAKRRGQTFLT